LRRRIERLAGDLLMKHKHHFEQLALHPPPSQQSKDMNGTTTTTAAAAAAVEAIGRDPLVRLETNMIALQMMLSKATEMGCATNAIQPITSLVDAMKQRLVILRQWKDRNNNSNGMTTSLTINSDGQQQQQQPLPSSNDIIAVEKAIIQLEKIVRDSMMSITDLIRDIEINTPTSGMMISFRAFRVIVPSLSILFIFTFQSRQSIDRVVLDHFFHVNICGSIDIGSAFRSAPGYRFSGKAYDPTTTDKQSSIINNNVTKAPLQIYTELARGQDNIAMAHRLLDGSSTVKGGSFTNAPRNPSESAANRREIPSPLKQRYPFLMNDRERRALERAKEGEMSDLPIDVVKPRLAAAAILPITSMTDDERMAASKRETRRQLRLRMKGRLADPSKMGPGTYDPGYVLDKHITGPNLGPVPGEEGGDDIDADENGEEITKATDRLPKFGVSTTGALGPGGHLINERRTQASIPGFKIVDPDANRGEESPQAQKRKLRDRIREILLPRFEEASYPADAPVLNPHIPTTWLDNGDSEPSEQQKLAVWRSMHRYNELLNQVAAAEDRRATRAEGRAREIDERHLANQRRSPTRARSLSPIHKLRLRLRYPSPPPLNPDDRLTQLFDRKPVFGYHLPGDDYGKENGVTARRKIWAMERKRRNEILAAKLAAAAERTNLEREQKEAGKVQPFELAGDRPVAATGDEPEGNDRGLLEADRWRNYGNRAHTGADFGKSRPRVEPTSRLLEELEPREGDELLLNVDRGHRYLHGHQPSGVAWNVQQGRPEMTLSDTEVDYSSRRHGREMPAGMGDVRKSGRGAGHKFDHDLPRNNPVIEDDRELYLSPRYDGVEPAVHSILFGARTSAQRPPVHNPASRELGGFIPIDDDILHRRTRQTNFSSVTGRYDNDAPRSGLLASIPNDGDILALSPRAIRGHQPGVEMKRGVGRDDTTGASPRNDPARFLHLKSPKRDAPATDFTRAAPRFPLTLSFDGQHDGDELLLDPVRVDDARAKGYVSMASRQGRTDLSANDSKEQRLVLSPHRVDSKSMIQGPTFNQQIGRPQPYSVDGHPEEGDHLLLDPQRQDHVPGFVFGTSERFPDIPADWIGRPSLMDLKQASPRESKSPKEDNRDILRRVQTIDYHRFPLDPTRADSMTKPRSSITQFAPESESPTRATAARHGGLPHAVVEPNPLRGASMKGPSRFKSNGQLEGIDEATDDTHSNDGILDRDTSTSPHIKGAGRFHPEHIARRRLAIDQVDEDNKLENNQPQPIIDPPPVSSMFANRYRQDGQVVDDRFELNPRYESIEDRAPVPILRSSTNRFPNYQSQYDDNYLHPNDEYTRKDPRATSFALHMSSSREQPIVPPVQWHNAAAPLPSLLAPPSQHLQLITDRYYAPLANNTTTTTVGNKSPRHYVPTHNENKTEKVHGDEYDIYDHPPSTTMQSTKTTVTNRSHVSPRQSFQQSNRNNVSPGSTAGPTTSARTRPLGPARSNVSVSVSSRYQPLPISGSSSVPTNAPPTTTTTTATTEVDDTSPRMVAHVSSLLRAKHRRQQRMADATTR
jgi:hypothetical protein